MNSTKTCKKCLCHLVVPSCLVDPLGVKTATKGHETTKTHENSLCWLFNGASFLHPKCVFTIAAFSTAGGGYHVVKKALGSQPGSCHPFEALRIHTRNPKIRRFDGRIIQPSHPQCKNRIISGKSHNLRTYLRDWGFWKKVFFSFTMAIFGIYLKIQGV